MQGMLHKEEESYKDEAVLLQKSVVSTRYFAFPTLLEAAAQEGVWVNSDVLRERELEVSKGKCPKLSEDSSVVAVAATSQSSNSSSS